MRSLQQRHIILTGVCAGFSLLVAGCQPKADPANTKRWESFQKDNQAGVVVGQDAFERRQKELAAKRDKTKTTKPDEKSKDASPAPTKP